MMVTHEGGFAAVTKADESTLFCPCGAWFTWSGFSDELEPWRQAHRPHLTGKPVAVSAKDLDLVAARARIALLEGLLREVAEHRTQVDPAFGRGTVTAPLEADILDRIDRALEEGEGVALTRLGLQRLKAMRGMDQLDEAKMEEGGKVSVREMLYEATPEYYRLAVVDRQANRLVAIDAGDVLDALNLDYWTGSVLAHVWRAGRKEGETALEALRNARACLDRSIANLERLERFGDLAKCRFCDLHSSLWGRNLDPTVCVSCWNSGKR